MDIVSSYLPNPEYHQDVVAKDTISSYDDEVISKACYEYRKEHHLVRKYEVLNKTSYEYMKEFRCLRKLLAEGAKLPSVGLVTKVLDVTKLNQLNHQLREYEVLNKTSYEYMKEFRCLRKLLAEGAKLPSMGLVTKVLDITKLNQLSQKQKHTLRSLEINK